MKNWQKIGVSVLTVGVTVTAIYFGVKAIKKHMAKKAEQKKAEEKPKVEVKK